MRVAVLGARGFVGSYITKHLRNHSVIAVTRDTVDLTNFRQVQDWLAETAIDVVVNCATAGGKQTIGENNYADVQNNLSIFLNFYNNRHLFKKFINVGSGAEFNRDTNINLVREDDIVKIVPAESYGYSKNIIARICRDTPEFYTLRLFGCFDSSEPEFRLLKRLLSSDNLEIQDRLFDFMSLSDFTRIVDFVIDNTPLYQDINCVYSGKIRLSEFLKLFCQIHDIKINFTVTGQNNNNYIGDGRRLKALNISLDGLNKGLKEYEPS